MAGKGVPRSWLGSLQSTPCLLTCHTPSIVGIAPSRGALSTLHTSEVLAARPRVITVISVLSFICFPLVDFVFVVMALFDSSFLSCHFWPFVDVQNGNQREVMRKLGVPAERHGSPAFARQLQRAGSRYHGSVYKQKERKLRSAAIRLRRS